MKRANGLTLFSMAVLLSFIAAPSAWSAPDDVLQPCHDDVQKFCAKVKPGRGRMSRCLNEHEADLSEACKSRLQEMRGHMAEARAACSDDAKKFCKDAGRGHGRIIACLKSHEAELSDACKEEMKR
mgnify:FL=1